MEVSKHSRRLYGGNTNRTESVENRMVEIVVQTFNDESLNVESRKVESFNAESLNVETFNAENQKT
jgi:hypothetical protein